MNKTELLNLIKGEIIVSCQALPPEPLYNADFSLMPFMAQAAKEAGSKMIRTSGVRDVIGIKEKTGLPVIGLIKKTYDGYDVYITPTMKEVDALVEAGSDIIALDLTKGSRPNGLSAGEFVKVIREKYPNIILMADISTYEEGIEAAKSGVDIVSTTMSGYTAWSEKMEGPDKELVQRLVSELDIPVVAEGRIHSPQQAKEMLDAGAYAVVVGGAITRPLQIAQKFFEVVKKCQD